MPSPNFICLFYIFMCIYFVLLNFSSVHYGPCSSFQNEGTLPGFLLCCCFSDSPFSSLILLVLSLDCCLCCFSGSFGRRQDDALSSTSSTTTTTTSTSSVTSPTGHRSLLSRYQHTQQIEHPNETPRVRCVSKLCRCVTGIGQKRVRKRRRRKSRPRSSPQSTLQPPPLPPPLLELYWALTDARDAGTHTHTHTHTLCNIFSLRAFVHILDLLCGKHKNCLNSMYFGHLSFKEEQRRTQ